jgi:hypothetical protein
METVKIKVHDPNNLEVIKEIDSLIDKEVVDDVSSILKNSEKYQLTPIMFEPETDNVLFGVIQKTNEGFIRKYQIKIEKV